MYKLQKYNNTELGLQKHDLSVSTLLTCFVKTVYQLC